MVTLLKNRYLEIREKFLKYKKIDILINNAQRDHIPKKKSSKFENLFETYPIKNGMKVNIGLKGLHLLTNIWIRNG